MDFSRLVALLETRKLIIPRADQFEDPYEGLHSQKTVELLRDSLMSLQEPLGLDAADHLIGINDEMRRRMFVTCWSAMQGESAALWKLYVQGREGVAILSDYDALSRALDRSPFMARLSLVKYVNYETEPTPTDTIFSPFLHKRTSFAHEHELRGLIWALEQNPAIQQQVTSISIDVDPPDLINAVHVSPIAPHWFGDLVEQIVSRYELKTPVIRSTLYARPAYLARSPSASTARPPARPE